MPKKAVIRLEAGTRPLEVLAVLEQPAEARKEFFKNYWAAHSRILDVAKDLLQLIYEPADAEVIYLLGPTGVGKTTVMLYVIAELYKKALPELVKEKGRVPAAFIEAENPDKGAYNWRDHYIATLRALDEVLIERKVYLPEPGVGRGELKSRWGRALELRAAWRSTAQNALKHRIMYAFFVDEAQFITKRKSGEGLMNQADTVRSIASKSKTLHVLVGTYDLRHLRNLNGQLGRRSHTIHFRRYKTDGLSGGDKIKELESFGKAFKSFQEYLPVVEQPDLLRHIDFCFTRCLGRVGRLKSWFVKSLAIALEENAATVSSEIFLKAAPSIAEWKQSAQEILDGEAALDETDSELEEEFGKLGAAGGPAETKAESKTGISKEPRTKNGKRGSALNKTNRRGRPFLPKAERYPIGTKQNA